MKPYSTKHISNCNYNNPYHGRKSYKRYFKKSKRFQLKIENKRLFEENVHPQNFNNMWEDILVLNIQHSVLDESGFMSTERVVSNNYVLPSTNNADIASARLQFMVQEWREMALEPSISASGIEFLEDTPTKIVIRHSKKEYTETFEIVDDILSIHK